MFKMFNFLKKKITAFQVASYLVMDLSKYTDSISQTVDEFIKEKPSYSIYKIQLLDELQWVITSCGVIAIRILTDVPTAKHVVKQVSAVYSKIHKTNDEKTMFTPEFIHKLALKTDAYLVRFNRGLIMRADSSSDPSFLFNEASQDLANETMKYITGTSRATEIDMDNMFELQKRTADEDALEIFVTNVIKQFIMQYKEKFLSFRIVSS